MMQEHTIPTNPKSRKKHIRRGRGDSAGRGSFSGRGCKGQLSRTGKKVKAWFEGGQTSFLQKIPKRKGFRPINKKRYFALNVADLEILDNGSAVTLALLREKGIITKKEQYVKILGNGTLSKKLIIALPCSASAKAKIEQAGGNIEEKK